MSYILEALKKSEKKRQGKPSNLAHLAMEETPEQKHTSPRRPLWPLILGFALVINAGVMLIIFWPSQSTVPDSSAPDTTSLHAQKVNSIALTAEATESVAQNTAPPESKRMEETPRDEAQSPNSGVDDPAAQMNQRETPPAALPEEIQPGTPRSSDVVTTSIPTGERKQATADSAKEITKEVTTSVIHPGPERETRAMEADIVAEPEPMRFSDLPLEYRRRLPEIHMSVHAYSESPSAGLIRANNKMLRQGSYLTDGVRLEKITREGAIFSYAGQRFLLPRR